MSVPGDDLSIDYPESTIAEAIAVDTVLFTIDQFAPECPCAVVLTAEGVDSTHVRVNIEPAVLLNEAVLNPDVWSVTPPGGAEPITVTAVVAESDPVASVLLTTNEHQSLPDYEVTLDYLETA